MDYFDGIPVKELYDALDSIEGKEPIKRLLAAIEHKIGVTETELVEWHDT